LDKITPAIFYIFLLEAHKASNKASIDLKKVAGNAFAAFTIGSTVLSSPIANAVEAQPFTFSSSNIIAEKVVRQGLYSEYEVDIVQQRDDARSTFKDASETKSKKGTFYCLEAAGLIL
jgi:hypothetical protein